MGCCMKKIKNHCFNQNFHYESLTIAKLCPVHMEVCGISVTKVQSRGNCIGQYIQYALWTLTV